MNALEMKAIAQKSFLDDKDNLLIVEKVNNLIKRAAEKGQFRILFANRSLVPKVYVEGDMDFDIALCGMLHYYRSMGFGFASNIDDDDNSNTIITWS